MKSIVGGALLVLLSGNLYAGLGPDSDWGTLYQSRFYEPRMPIIAFEARPSTGIKTWLVLKKVKDVSYYRTSDGREWLYGGWATVCARYTVTGSLSDSRRRCLATEVVPLVRERAYQFRYCTFRSDENCQAYASHPALYPLQYSVPVMYRTSESDSFSMTHVAFEKPVQIPYCEDCARRFGH